MNRQPILSARKSNSHPVKREEDVSRRLAGRMVLCLGDMPSSAVIERYFQERGWRVHLAESPCQARTLVREHRASVALLAEEPAGHESAWLTSWKMLHAAPRTRVIILGATHAERGERRAAQVGAAAYLHTSESAAAIYRTLLAFERSTF